MTMRMVLVDDAWVHDPTCTGCEHDCPWRRHHIGPPFCGVCDDHAEAVHAGYGDVPCDCPDHSDDNYTGPTYPEYDD